MPSIPLLISAGETSGDLYAARLATALRSRLDVALFGMGGPQMRAAGVDVVTDYSEVSVVGIGLLVCATCTTSVRSSGLGGRGGYA